MLRKVCTGKNIRGKHFFWTNKNIKMMLGRPWSVTPDLGYYGLFPQGVVQFSESKFFPFIY